MVVFWFNDEDEASDTCYETQSVDGCETLGQVDMQPQPSAEASANPLVAPLPAQHQQVDVPGPVSTAQPAAALHIGETRAQQQVFELVVQSAQPVAELEQPTHTKY